jgi:hypothetical protein
MIAAHPGWSMVVAVAMMFGASAYNIWRLHKLEQAAEQRKKK